VLSRQLRPAAGKLLEPIARALLSIGVTPDVVTAIGTAGVATAALVFYPQGQLLTGTLVITLFVLSDALDGTMARLGGTASRWGAFLDSVLDRVGDAAIFSGLALWFAAEDNQLGVALSLLCLVLGAVVSYAKARAEGLGMTADVGFAERTDRLIAVLVGAGFVGLGLPTGFLIGVLLLLAIASGVTVFQRIVEVRRQAVGEGSSPAGGQDA
jgi:CDP-diacylglycerol--glycerol-3-phosphate 3-phosphatidyltransferase